MTRHRQVGLKKIGINRQILPIFVIDILLQIRQVRCHSPQTFQDLPAQSLKQLALSVQVFLCTKLLTTHISMKIDQTQNLSRNVKNKYHAYQVTQVSNMSNFGVRNKNSLGVFPTRSQCSLSLQRFDSH